MTYQEAVEWLYASQLFGIRLGLENMRRLCAALEIDVGPQPDSTASDRSPVLSAFPSLPAVVGLEERSPAQGVEAAERPVFIHVAGTNGKGSVCAMLDSILRSAGWRTGLYTSPHLVTFRERIRLNGEMIPEDDVAAGLTRIREMIEGWESAPTFFEIVTALALLWFQEQKAHVAVLETGLGGRLDATNVVTPAVSVLTSIALDHEKYLGAALAEIAEEKAGIIKPGIPVLSSRQPPDAAEVIIDAAKANGCFWLIVDEPSRCEVALAGSHQLRNAALAERALIAAGSRAPFLHVSASHVAEGLAHVEWPGRFQRVGEGFVLDGAHNPAAAAQLAMTWQEVFGQRKGTLILGVMRDKDVRGVSAALAPIAVRVFTVTVNNVRSCTAAELAQTMREVAPSLEVREFPHLAEAIAAAESCGDMALIAGSLFLVGEALVALGLAEAAPEVSGQ